MSNVNNKWTRGLLATVLAAAAVSLTTNVVGEWNNQIQERKSGLLKHNMDVYGIKKVGEMPQPVHDYLREFGEPGTYSLMVDGKECYAQVLRHHKGPSYKQVTMNCP